MPRLEDDHVPRLLLTVLQNERCSIPWCGQPLVRGFATPGLVTAMPEGTDLAGPFCLNTRCPKALGALGPLGSLKDALRQL